MFRRIFIASRWLHQRLSKTGLTLLLTTAFAAALGVNTEFNLAHTLFALGASLLALDALALAWLRRRLRRSIGLTARRALPPFVTCGEPAHYRIELHNQGARTTPAFALVERLRQGWPTAPVSRQRRQAKRYRPGYAGFLVLLRRLRAVDVERCELAPLLPGQRRSVTVALLPTARGLAVFEALCLVLTGPLGLAENRLELATSAATLPVLPQRLPLTLPAPTNHRLLQPGGISLAQHVGEAEEFRSLRDYRPGDPLRSIHWRSFARLGTPVVREFQEEFFARHTLVLDTAAAYAFAPAFETAVSMAAWLVAAPRQTDSLLDLLFVGERVHRVSAGRGLGGTETLLRVLAGVTPTPPEDIDKLLASVERNANRVSSLVAIFLAWDEPRQAAVRRLLARGIRPTVLVVEQAPASAATEDAAFAGLLQRIVVPDPRARTQAA